MINMHHDAYYRWYQNPCNTGIDPESSLASLSLYDTVHPLIASSSPSSTSSLSESEFLAPLMSEENNNQVLISLF